MRAVADCHIHIRGGRFQEIEKMLDEVASMGVTEASLLALPFRSVSENLSALYWKMNYKKIRLRAFGGLHQTDRFAYVPYEEQVMKLLELGCDGIKLMDMCPELRKLNGKGVNHPSYDKMFSLLENKGVPVLMHVNDPREFWEIPDSANCEDEIIKKGGYIGLGFSAFEDIYSETLQMLDKHPKLKVILAHFFFLADDIGKAAYVLDTYPNVRFDLTPGWEMFIHFSKNIEEWRKFFIKYSNRILFGTDTNTYKAFNKEINQLVYTAITHDETEFHMPCYGNHVIKGLYLPDDVVDRICYTNFIEFVGSEIKPVDVEGFYDSAEYILAEMRKNPKDVYYEAGCDIFADLKKDPEQKTAILFLEQVMKEKRRKGLC